MNLDEWLDEADRIRAQNPGYYNNDILGTPKFDNGFDRLYYQGMSPQEALIFWAEYR